MGAPFVTLIVRNSTILDDVGLHLPSEGGTHLLLFGAKKRQKRQNADYDIDKIKGVYDFKAHLNYCEVSWKSEDLNVCFPAQTILFYWLSSVH